MKKDTPKNITAEDIRAKETTNDSFVKILFDVKNGIPPLPGIVARYERVADDCDDSYYNCGYALAIPLLKLAIRSHYAVKCCMAPKNKHKTTLTSIKAEYRMEQVIKSLKVSIATYQPDEIRVIGGIIQVG